MLFCITGHVGAGKSSVLEELRKQGIEVLTEPIDEWAVVLNAVDNNVPYAQILLQAMVAQWYAKLARDQAAGALPPVAFVERSPTCGLAFARALEASYEGFAAAVDVLHLEMAGLHIDGYFNLTVPFEVLVERVAARQQPGDTKWANPDAYAAHERIMLEVWPLGEAGKVTDVDGTLPVAEVANAIVAAMPEGVDVGARLLF